MKLSVHRYCPKCIYLGNVGRLWGRKEIRLCGQLSLVSSFCRPRIQSDRHCCRQRTKYEQSMSVFYSRWERKPGRFLALSRISCMLAKGAPSSKAVMCGWAAVDKCLQLPADRMQESFSAGNESDNLSIVDWIESSWSPLDDWCEVIPNLFCCNVASLPVSWKLNCVLVCICL